MNRIFLLLLTALLGLESIGSVRRLTDWKSDVNKILQKEHQKISTTISTLQQSGVMTSNKSSRGGDIENVEKTSKIQRNHVQDFENGHHDNKKSSCSNFLDCGSDSSKMQCWEMSAQNMKIKMKMFVSLNSDSHFSLEFEDYKTGVTKKACAQVPSYLVQGDQTQRLIATAMYGLNELTSTQRDLSFEALKTLDGFILTLAITTYDNSSNCVANFKCEKSCDGGNEGGDHDNQNENNQDRHEGSDSCVKCELVQTLCDPLPGFPCDCKIKPCSSDDN